MKKRSSKIVLFLFGISITEKSFTLQYRRVKLFIFRIKFDYVFTDHTVYTVHILGLSDLLCFRYSPSGFQLLYHQRLNKMDNGICPYWYLQRMISNYSVQVLVLQQAAV